ncbi:MAG TPA: DUF4010 domain-containing protein [Draconibacterium sp.]|nr:DUF4010 domain-containing protein [Draconibacterium sp.]
MKTFAEIFHIVPPDIIKFLLVTLFSLLIGLEQRRHHINDETESLFGTDRTFTLIGIFGFILYVINPQTLVPFLGGGIALIVLLAISYYQKTRSFNKFGITSLITALITYCFAPLVFTQPHWLVLLVVVSILILTELKGTLREFSIKIDNNEFITLAKFLVIAGVILPLLPDTPISAEINISPYKFWMAIVAVSGISYLSYLLKKFVFPNSGIVLTGILGGLYSSTATTIILAKKSNELQESNKVSAAIILATTMMFLRIFILALIFNDKIALLLAPSFGVFVVVSILIAVYFLKFRHKHPTDEKEAQAIASQNNPLEFKTALIFAALFIFFGLLTGFVNKQFGTSGLNVLSFVVGVTDIDPFILNLFQSKWDIADSALVMAVLNAISSNNLLKMIYGLSFGNKSIRAQLITGFSILVVLGLLFSFVIHL